MDYGINPYIECQHSYIHCYAEFMIRFTGHKGEKWGEFLDEKTFNWNRLKPQKYDGKLLLLSSIADPYISLEKKIGNTWNILEWLVGTNAELRVLTKSNLVVRDIDLFKQFNNIEVGISISTFLSGKCYILKSRETSSFYSYTKTQSLINNFSPSFFFNSQHLVRILKNSIQSIFN